MLKLGGVREAVSATVVAIAAMAAIIAWKLHQQRRLRRLEVPTRTRYQRW
jgi:hypothetical protein